jgi:hypothetical protein
MRNSLFARWTASFVLGKDSASTQSIYSLFPVVVTVELNCGLWWLGPSLPVLVGARSSVLGPRSAVKKDTGMVHGPCYAQK